MTAIVILLLGTAWAAYGIVWWRDGRAPRQAFGRDDRHGFDRTLGSLAGSSSRSRHLARGGALAGTGEVFRVPRTAAEAARRRTEVLVALTGFAFVTFLGAVAFGGAVWFVQVLADTALLSFGYAVAQRRSLELERQMKVSMLHPPADTGAVTGHGLDELGRVAEA